MILRLLALSIFLGACHAPVRSHIKNWDALTEDQRRERIVSDAYELGRHRRFRVNGRSFPYDCSGYVAALLYENGFNVFEGTRSMNVQGNGVKLIHDFARRQGALSTQEASPGDIVFFSDTFDKNRDGKINDPLTHIGIVTDLRRDGTIEFMHLIRGHVRRRLEARESSTTTYVDAIGRTPLPRRRSPLKPLRPSPAWS